MARDPAEPLVLELGREMVVVLAPAELPLYDSISRAYLADPERVLAAGAEAQEDDPLGFGVTEAQTMLTPVVLAVVAHVVTGLVEETKTAASRQGTALVREWLEWAVGKLRPAQRQAGPAATPALTFTREQLVAVRQQAIDRALALKMAPARAELLADSLVGRLAVGAR